MVLTMIDATSGACVGESRSCVPKNEYSCDSGQCVPITFVCDNDHDCADASDEQHCRKGTLQLVSIYFKN